jgi:hypothetical protein
VVEFFLRHPAAPCVTARIGTAPERGGMYIDIEYGAGMKVAYDATVPGFDIENPTVGILIMACSFELLSWSDVLEARQWIVEPWRWHRGRPCLPRRLRRTLRVLERLRLVRDG